MDAAAQIVDIVADRRELETEETLAGAEVAQVQQEVDFGADRAPLFERLVLRCRQREKQVSVTLGEARKAAQKLVLFGREDLQAIALWEAVTAGIVERFSGLESSRRPGIGLGVAGLLVAGLLFGSAGALEDDSCPSSDPDANYNCPNGPAFALPSWVDFNAWTDPSQYTTMKTGTLLGGEKTQLIGRSPGGLEVWNL